MKPPCKQCLKYAICIAQTQLSCEDFYKFFNDMHDKLKMKHGAKVRKNGWALSLEERNEAWDELWNEVYKCMPNCQGLFRGEKKQKMPRYPKPVRVSSK